MNAGGMSGGANVRGKRAAGECTIVRKKLMHILQELI